MSHFLDVLDLGPVKGAVTLAARARTPLVAGPGTRRGSEWSGLPVAIAMASLALTSCSKTDVHVYDSPLDPWSGRHLTASVTEAPHIVQIGRASCRERVYVLV